MNEQEHVKGQEKTLSVKMPDFSGIVQQECVTIIDSDGEVAYFVSMSDPEHSFCSIRWNHWSFEFPRMAVDAYNACKKDGIVETTKIEWSDD